MSASTSHDEAVATDRRPGDGQEQKRDAHNPPKILVVDDEEAMRDSCRQVLERDGYQVRTVRSGDEGLDMLATEEPDVLLVDLKMPGMNGEELLRRAREIAPEVASVAITGYPTLDSAIDMMKAGACDYLPKPFKADELRRVIARALQTGRLAQKVAAAERERERMRDNFVAVVSHQLKSPAAAVKECLDVALAAFSDRMPQGCRDLVERAAARSGLLLDLMDDWLTLAKVESAGIEAAEEPLCLQDVIRDAVAAAEESPHHNDVELEVEVQAEPVSVVGDREALRSMLFNLLDNALRYTPDGGRATAGLRCSGRRAVLTVTDTGPGIPQHEQPLVFEPFYRGSGVRQRQGTGLGLPIAKRIAEAHGGRIVLRSRSGEGTTFEVHLPREGGGE